MPPFFLALFFVFFALSRLRVRKKSTAAPTGAATEPKPAPRGHRAPLRAFASFYRRRDLPPSGKTCRHSFMPFSLSSSRLRVFA